MLACLCFHIISFWLQSIDHKISIAILLLSASRSQHTVLSPTLQIIKFQLHLERQERKKCIAMTDAPSQQPPYYNTYYRLLNQDQYSLESDETSEDLAKRSEGEHELDLLNSLHAYSTTITTTSATPRRSVQQ